MQWYENVGPGHQYDARDEAQFRMWFSLIILSLREYCALHRMGYLKDGKMTQECQRIGKQKKAGNTQYCHRVISIDSPSEVAVLLEFLHGDGLTTILEILSMKETTERVIRNGLKEIEKGNIPTMISHEPDFIDRSIRLWRA